MFAWASEAAAASGRLDCLRYVHDRAGAAIMTGHAATWVTVAAVKSESMEVLAWLRLQGYTFSSKALVEACSNGTAAWPWWSGCCRRPRCS